MQKRYIFIALGLLIIFLAATCSYGIHLEYGKYQKNMLKQQQLVAARHHLLCEVLQPMMSEDEVLMVLRQAGEFRFRRSELSADYITLDITFTDPKGKDLYGYFDLVFIDYKYVGADVPQFDVPESICDFSQATP